jgi:hypothetical protein
MNETKGNNKRDLARLVDYYRMRLGNKLFIKKVLIKRE